MMTLQSVAMLAQIFQVLTLTCPLNTWTAQIQMAEPAHKKTKCEHTFLYTPKSVNAWLEIDVGPDLPSLRSTQILVRHKSCASTELGTDTELDVTEDEKGNEDKTKRKKGIRSPKKPGKKKVRTNIGTIMILPIVKIFGILSFIIYS